MSLDKAGCIPLNGGMDQIAPTADDIRQKLLDRADAFARKHEISLSRIGLEALRDSKFLSEVRAGRNFTIGSYQAVMDWIDAEEERRRVAA
jgi:hypothetical protein